MACTSGVYCCGGSAAWAAMAFRSLPIIASKHHHPLSPGTPLLCQCVLLPSPGHSIASKSMLRGRHSARCSAALARDHDERLVVGLAHHNLASQSVFEPSFDLTVANESTQHRYALKHFWSRATARSPRVAFLCSGFTANIATLFHAVIQHSNS